jgi:hypothetical protein
MAQKHSHPKLKFKKFNPPKPIKLVWVKAPPSFNREALRSKIRAYIARQRFMRREIRKCPILYGQEAA